MYRYNEYMFVIMRDDWINESMIGALGHEFAL